MHGRGWRGMRGRAMMMIFADDKVPIEEMTRRMLAEKRSKEVMK
jgi:hypothetical protein